MLLHHAVVLAAAEAEESAYGGLRLWALLLVGVLLAGAVILAVVDAWRKQSRRTLGPTADEELTQFRAMYDRGEISLEEFQRLKSVLGGRIRSRMGSLKHPEVEQPPRNPTTLPPNKPEQPGSTDIQPE